MITPVEGFDMDALEADLAVDLPTQAQPDPNAEPEGEGGHVLRTADIDDALKGAKILADQLAVTIDAGLALRRMIRTLQPIAEDLAAERQKIADQFAEKDADGQPIETPNGTAIDNTKIRAWRLKYEALQRKKHRVHGLEPIKLSALVSQRDREADKPAKIHAGALAMLGVLLDEG